MLSTPPAFILSQDQTLKKNLESHLAQITCLNYPTQIVGINLARIFVFALFVSVQFSRSGLTREALSYNSTDPLILSTAYSPISEAILQPCRVFHVLCRIEIDLDSQPVPRLGWLLPLYTLLNVKI